MGQVIHSDMVKRALRNLGTATPAQVSAELEIEDAPGKLQVRGILRDLKKSGGAERDAQGQYRLVDDPSRRGGVQAKLWEFMCLRFGKAQPWTTRDAAKRAECNWDYTKRYTQFLAGEKVVEPVGQEGNAVLYRVIPGMEKAPAPHWNRRAETRRKGPSLDDYAGKPLPEDHPGRELIIHSLAAEPVSPPPPPPKITILDAVVQVRVKAIMGKMRRALNVAAGEVQEAQEVLEEMEQDLRQLFAGDPKSEAENGQPTGDH